MRGRSDFRGKNLRVRQEGEEQQKLKRGERVIFLAVPKGNECRGCDITEKRSCDLVKEEGSSGRRGKGEAANRS